MGYPDLSKIYDDVEHGLASQSHRLNDAALAQAFWDYLGKRFMQVFLRDGETPFDYIQRPYRAAGLTRQIITVLTEHLYSPGPSRTWDVPAGDAFLKTVYADNHFDAMMLRADQLSSLNDVAAIQVDADEGNFADRPITLRLWGADQFHAWTDPENATIPKVCCTIDDLGDKKVYRVWTEKNVRIYETPKNELVAGGRAAVLVGQEDHDYGCLPFAFVHYNQPITQFWEVGIGGFISQAEIRCNDRLSRLDESVNKHLNPLPVMKNCDPNLQVILEPQRFLRLNKGGMQPQADGGMGEPPDPDVFYLSAVIDVVGSWDDLTRYVNQVLAAIHVPLSAVRMEQEGVASGISLVVEQAPLLTRARARRRPFGLYETEIARTILRCAGNHYGRRDLVAAAQSGSLALGWPQPTVPVPTADNLELLLRQVSAGLKSLVMAVMEWYGLDEEGALNFLEEVERQNNEAKKRLPSMFRQGETEREDAADDESDDRGTGELSGSDQDRRTRDMKQLVMDV